MLLKILIIVLISALTALLLYILHSKKCIKTKTLILVSVCCAVVIITGGALMLFSKTDSNSGFTAGTTQKPSETVDRNEEKRVMDMIMWYDIDIGPTTNGRPVKGWWPLNPNHPDKVTVNGNYRTTTPLLGLYDQRKTETARQHLYWISALGCNAVAVDWTNYTSYRFAAQSSGADWYKYCMGVYKNTEVMLDAAVSEVEFETPDIYCTVRMQGTDEEGLKAILDDVYALYEQYPSAYYKFDDGTSQKDKPFVVIFIDGDIRESLLNGKWIFKDERFNIRFSNGYLTSSTVMEKDGTRSIAGDVPLWLFVESEEDPNAGEGMYKIYHKDSQDGSTEQMIAWASLHKGGENWDELNNIINGMTTFERTLRGVAELSPKALLVNRFNYAIAWKEQPQEGLSLYASTHIEPNEDFGFLVFDNVKTNLYKLNNWSMYYPDKAVVTSAVENALFIDLKGYPTEYRVSLSQEELGEWTYYNINNGIEIKDEWKGKKCYIQIRNTFGESAVTEYTVDAGS